MMKYSYSSRTKNLQGDAIEAVLKYSSMPGYIPFSAGNPSVDSFPVDEIKEISARILEEQPNIILQYNVTEGYHPFRDYLKGYLKKKYNVGKDFDDIVIISGSQQASDLISKGILNEGDTVLCDEITYMGFLNAFTSYGGRLKGIPMDDDGMNMEAFEKALETEKNVKMIYTIPNFQNPTGITMPLAKRKKMYELAAKHNVIILEDNPYGDLRYSGEAIESIKSMDEEGCVVYVGSCSKVIAPGLRIGYAVAAEPLIRKMIECKQTSDVNSNLWGQEICYEYMTKYDYEGHLKFVCDLYAHKQKIMFDAFKKYLSGKMTWSKVEGGLFAWCILPEEINMNEFCQKALEKEKVCVVPGDVFSAEASIPCNGFRVNFSTPSVEQIEEGVKRLARLI